MDKQVFSQFIGLKWGEQVTDQHIKRANKAVRMIRVLKPNSIMTMDLRHDRANVFIEYDGTIMSITMG